MSDRTYTVQLTERELARLEVLLDDKIAEYRARLADVATWKDDPELQFKAESAAAGYLDRLLALLGKLEAAQ